MPSLNVLVIAYYFPPMGLSGVQRTLKFIKYLPEYGWNPIVLTSNPVAYYAFDETLNADIETTTPIYRTEEDITKFARKNHNSTINYPSKFAKNIQSKLLQTFILPDSRRSWLKLAVKKAEEVFANHQIDLIFATAPPFTDFLVAKTLSEKYDVPYTIDYRDLWADNPYYFYPTFFHKNYAINLEQRVLETTARAIVITRDMKNALLNRYRFLNHNDVAIIPHGYDRADFEKNNQQIKSNGKMVITHSGIFSADLTPIPFLNAVKLLFKENPKIAEKIEFRFLGLLQKQYQRKIAKLKYADAFNLLGYVEHSEVIKHLLSSDLLWLMFPKPIVTPSRFYEYLGANKPILVSSYPNEITKIAESTGASFVTKPFDVQEIKKALVTAFKLWDKNALPAPIKSITDKYDRKYLSSLLSIELANSLKTKL